MVAAAMGSEVEALEGTVRAVAVAQAVVAAWVVAAALEVGSMEASTAEAARVAAERHRLGIRCLNSHRRENCAPSCSM